jgi:hypothetical protein
VRTAHSAQALGVHPVANDDLDMSFATAFHARDRQAGSLINSAGGLMLPFPDVRGWK